MREDLSIGVDIGGTHITAAIIDLEQKKIHGDRVLRFHIDAHASALEIYEQWSHAIHPFLNETTKIGIAMPGPFDYENGISLMQGQDKYDQFYNVNIKNGFAAFLNIEPTQIRFLNDAACFLQGEVVGGAAVGYQKALGLTLGTGLGSTYFQHGKAFDADMWNIPFHEQIAEDYISSRWFTKTYEKITNQKIANVKAIVDLGDQHEIVCQLFNEFSENLASFIYRVHQRHAAEIVVIGGSIAMAWRLFGTQTQALLAQNGLDILLVPAILSEKAALIGAGSLWLDF